MKVELTKDQLFKGIKLWMDVNYGPDKLEEVRTVRHPHSIYYKKNGKVVMEKMEKENYFWFDNEYIWSFIESFFSIDYLLVKSLLKRWIEETFGLYNYEVMCKYFSWED